MKDWRWLVTPTRLPLVGKKQVKRIKEGSVSHGAMWPPTAPGQASASQADVRQCLLTE